MEMLCPSYISARAQMSVFAIFQKRTDRSIAGAIVPSKFKIICQPAKWTSEALQKNRPISCSS